MKSEIQTALIIIIIITIGISVISIVLSTLDTPMQTSDKSLETNPPVKINKSEFKMAPDLIGIAYYLNTTPEKLSKEIKDKIVLYDFWTYSCINCIRTLPYITACDKKYSEQGLLIIGVHSPEFEFEKDPENVKMAIGKHVINYPVVLDNDM